jgi:hypothetical protein
MQRRCWRPSIFSPVATRRRQRPATLALQLQLQSCLDVSASSGSLMGSSPYRPGYDLGGFDLLVSQPIGDAADFLDRPSDQLF